MSSDNSRRKNQESGLTKRWHVRYNTMDCYYELISPMGVLVHRFPTEAQALEGLELTQLFRKKEVANGEETSSHTGEGE